MEKSSRVSYQVAPGQSIPTTNGIPTAPWPIDVSAPQYMGTKFAVTAETSEPHGLSEDDLVTLSLDLNSVNITKNFKVRVSDYQTITYNKPSITTSLVTDVAFNATNLNITTVDAALFRENVILKLTMIFEKLQQLIQILVNLRLRNQYLLDYMLQKIATCIFR